LKNTLTLIFLLAILCCGKRAFSQNKPVPVKVDTIKVMPSPVDSLDASHLVNGLFKPLSDHFTREVEYDAVNQRYIIRTKIGGRVYGLPQYYTVAAYGELMEKELKERNWKNLSDKEPNEARQTGIIPEITVDSKAFTRIFGGSTIDIQPRGEANMSTIFTHTVNQNPLFNEKQRNQTSFDLKEDIKANVVGSVGNNLKMNINYSTQAGFAFETQKKLTYTGNDDAVIKKIELGDVSMPLNTTLIQGVQSLFGVKAQLQIGRLNITSVFSQKNSVSNEIKVKNGAQQSTFNLSADNYEVNKHYFVAQYFKNNYNKFNANPALITSGVNITRMEVWITNKSGATTDSRDVLAMMDLGENIPWNTAQITGGSSALPSGFTSSLFPKQSNNLLTSIPATARQSNSNDIVSFFAANGAASNFAKVTYARKLGITEYSYHAQLGYVMLNSPLNSGEVLAVAYQYTKNGRVYQVGEFASDVPVNSAVPNVLYVKLLKNETIQTALPTWGLMMKNIYSIGGYKINQANFLLDITRLQNSSGIESPVITEGKNTLNKRWLNLTGLDLVNVQLEKNPDGIFDFVTDNTAFSSVSGSTANDSNSGIGAGINTSLSNLVNSSAAASLVSVSTNSHRGYITIDPLNGRIIFPVLEPFGRDLTNHFNTDEQSLISQYGFNALYDSTKVIAQQLFPLVDRYVIKGSYESAASSVFSLNSTNVAQGTVKVYAGSVLLAEGTDFAVDYQAGTVTILNTALLSSGESIRITSENSDTFGTSQQTVFGTYLDYKVSNQLHFGATYMSLKEKPVSAKVGVGDEPLSNAMWGLDMNYNSTSKTLTRWLNKLPFLALKVPSAISFTGEFAKLVPRHSAAVDIEGDKNGVSFLDDFETTESVIDLKVAAIWRLSGTPQLFTESQLSNDLAYGYNRAKIAFYNIDPSLYDASSGSLPANLKNNRTELSNNYVRQVVEQEIFPNKEVSTAVVPNFSTFDLAYYPSVRGPYNYATTGVAADGSLLTPKKRWGGLIRRIDASDFQALNVGYVEMWIMDPNSYKPNSAGGDLYIDLGNISEDILKDGRKSLENGLSATDDPTSFDVTNWGRVPVLQPVTAAFENDAITRQAQDVGLDGLSDAQEKVKFAQVVDRLKAQVSGAAGTLIANDPSSDDYHYFRGDDLDQSNAGILKRYQNYNGTEGNSKTPQQSQEQLGIANSAATAIPDGEDVNGDVNMNQSDDYFEYKVSLRPADLIVGKNNVTDKIVSQVKLANGSTKSVTWYQIKVPISGYTTKFGDIDDFKSIRFMRMFMTNFTDTSIVRFGKLQLVKGEWWSYNANNLAAEVIADPAIVPANPDQSDITVAAVSIEENGQRTPIPYVLPAGVVRQPDYSSNYQGTTLLNEQSLSLTINLLKDGYSRAAFKVGYSDFRSYKRMKMDIHLEANGATRLIDNDLSAFIRIGTDNQDNYYEYVQPLVVTLSGARGASSIWPTKNMMDIELELFQKAKIARNSARDAKGLAWDITVPYAYADGANTIFVKGQPDMSKVRVYMLGLRNPLKSTGDKQNDDGLSKSAQVWFDELRLTDYNEKGGWAATGHLHAKLSDFGDVSVDGTKSTVGFGTLESRMNDRSRADQYDVNVNSNMELGKFLPASSNIKIPLYVSYTKQVSTPEYDPRMPDVELSKTLQGLSVAEKKAVMAYAQDFTTRNSISLTNVRKERDAKSGKPQLWDIENFNASYSYSGYLHHDYINESSVQKNYRGSLVYHYAGNSNYISPFNKIIKSNLLAVLRDVNINPMPTAINFRLDVNRYFSSTSLRSDDALDPVPVSTTYSKSFLITRTYGLNWNLTKSVNIDFDATNYSIVDEPDSKSASLKTDSVWNNLKRLGRTTNYNHNLNITYNLPINKLPYMDWVNVAARYGTNFDWQSEPLATLNDPTINLGNTIQNARTIQINPTFNFNGLYNKFDFYRNAMNTQDDQTTGAKILLGLLTSLKTLNAAYTQTKGIYLPGYLPTTSYLGIDKLNGAPGLGFVFGSQADIRAQALAEGWITTDTLQSQLYVNTLKTDLSVTATLEPLRGMRLTLTASKTKNMNYSSNFMYDSQSNTITNLNPTTTGDYSITFISLKTAFTDKTGSAVSRLFNQFMVNRSIISKRLGQANPNSVANPGAYADGYDKNSQDVVVAAFLAAYTGKDAHKSSMNAFPSIPLPNWRLNYGDLARLPFLSDSFQSIDIKHAYRATYNVSSFTSVPQYEEKGGSSNTRDDNGDFLPQYQFSEITIAETFSPLIGIDARLKNDVSGTFEIGRTRMLGLSLANSQLAQLSENNIVVGIGYRTNKFRFPFGLFKQVKMDNNMDFKLDVAIRDNKTAIYRADVVTNDISSGARNITMRPSVNYVLNKRFTLLFYYNTNLNKPYTSQVFTVSSTSLGFTLKMLFN